MAEKMVVIQRKIAELVHPEYNPRTISENDFRQLKASLERFDAVEPAIINTHAGRENIIVGGNQRIRAAQALGWPEFPCVEVTLTEEREKELNIRLNRNTGEWDFDALANNFDMKDLVSFGFEDYELGHTFERVFDDSAMKTGEAPTARLAVCPQCGHSFQVAKKHEKGVGAKDYAAQLAREIAESKAE